MMAVTVDSRVRDPQTKMVAKYYDMHGNVEQKKPIKSLSPDAARLTPLAKWMYEHLDGCWIGGRTLNGIRVRVESEPGRQQKLNRAAYGEMYDRMAEVWGFDPNARAVIAGWLFSVAEPDDDATNYFNREAARIASAAGVGGRVVIEGSVRDVTDTDVTDAA